MRRFHAHADTSPGVRQAITLANQRQAARGFRRRQATVSPGVWSRVLPATELPLRRRSEILPEAVCYDGRRSLAPGRRSPVAVSRLVRLPCPDHQPRRHPRPTGVFGFFALLRAGIRDNLDQPPEIVAVFDGEGGVARRRAVDPSYKISRPTGTPAAIKALADVKRGLGICGIPWIELGDEEADDVIAALTTRSGSSHVVIMSGDKDYYQLLSERVRILNTARKAGQRLIGPCEIPARYGVTPQQWCDFRALTGDPSDGITGIGGIGPKTAARLLEIGRAHV